MLKMFIKSSQYINAYLFKTTVDNIYEGDTDKAYFSCHSLKLIIKDEFY